MPSPHEDRFLEYYRSLFPGAPLTRELSVPGKARQIDLAHFGGGDMSHLGVLQPWVEGRVLLWEHQTRPASHLHIAKALMALNWAAIQYHSRETATRNAVRVQMQRQPNAPAMIVFAPVLVQKCRAMFREASPGVWLRGEPDLWGAPSLLCVAYNSLPDGPGTGALRCLAREPVPGAPDGGGRKFGLHALLDDPTLSTVLKNRVLEDIVHNRIHTGPEDQRTAVQRLRDEGREEGRRDVVEHLRTLVKQGALPTDVLRALDALPPSEQAPGKG